MSSAGDKVAGFTNWFHSNWRVRYWWWWWVLVPCCRCWTKGSAAAGTKWRSCNYRRIAIANSQLKILLCHKVATTLPQSGCKSFSTQQLCPARAILKIQIPKILHNFLGWSYRNLWKNKLTAVSFTIFPVLHGIHSASEISVTLEVRSSACLNIVTSSWIRC
jgi:hypothetical protein